MDSDHGAALIPRANAPKEGAWRTCGWKPPILRGDSAPLHQSRRCRGAAGRGCNHLMPFIADAPLTNVSVLFHDRIIVALIVPGIAEKNCDIAPTDAAKNALARLDFLHLISMRVLASVALRTRAQPMEHFSAQVVQGPLCPQLRMGNERRKHMLRRTGSVVVLAASA